MKQLLSIITLFVFFSCSNPATEETSFSWLEGEWKGMESDTAYFFENWKASGEALNGVGGMVI